MPIKLNGSSSGYTQIEAAAAAGDNTLTLPTASGTLMTTGGSNTFTANQVIEVTDNSNAALRITQLGTGLALRIEDEANPDSSPFVVTAAGNVGIGLDAPDTGMHLRVQGNTYFTAQYGVGNKGRYGADAVGAVIEAVGSIPITFYTNSVERARVLSDGKVLIGTSSEISGTGALQIVNGGGGDQIRIRNSSASAGRHWRYSVDSNNTTYIINQDTVGVYIGNGGSSWSGLSDERAKDIIEPITDAANKVSSLRAVIGKYKTDEEGKRRSFLIAQDVEAVLPEAVSVANQETGYLGLSYTEVIPLLVAAIKELTAKVEALEGGA